MAKGKTQTGKTQMSTRCPARRPAHRRRTACAAIYMQTPATQAFIQRLPHAPQFIGSVPYLMNIF
jgi:hypothetical protein